MKRLGRVETTKVKPKVAPAARRMRINPSKSLTLLKNVIKVNTLPRQAQKRMLSRECCLWQDCCILTHQKIPAVHKNPGGLEPTIPPLTTEERRLHQERRTRIQTAIHHRRAFGSMIQKEDVTPNSSIGSRNTRTSWTARAAAATAAVKPGAVAHTPQPTGKAPLWATNTVNHPYRHLCTHPRGLLQIPHQSAIRPPKVNVLRKVWPQRSSDWARFSN